MTSDVIINIALNSGGDTTAGSHGAILGFAASTAPAPMHLKELNAALQGHASLNGPMPLTEMHASFGKASPPPPMDRAMLLGVDASTSISPRPIAFSGTMAASENTDLNAPPPMMELSQNAGGQNASGIGLPPMPAELRNLASQAGVDEQPPIFRGHQGSGETNMAPQPQDLRISESGFGSAPRPDALEVQGTAGKGTTAETKRPTRS